MNHGCYATTKPSKHSKTTSEFTLDLWMMMMIRRSTKTNKEKKNVFCQPQWGKNEEIFLYTGILIAPNNEICKID
ncbi:hypothetical protein DERP_007256 [Dermatophagoides pteronyssinus]|uniref:Uncharacterized protein n=1 Tax=Dermatophagoides pteronyssinus TaxID=6956 RepID=A0ABQ8J3X3_DERPT|nr:hypothetical protein DERP_007256 [Dermatophagoides pteronyssinus]